MVSLSARIKHLIFINYLVPAERIAARLPVAVEVETTDTSRSYLTVAFLEFSRVGLGALSLPAARTMQLNIRTYVRYRGRPAIYFFRTYISGFLSLFGRMLGLPAGRLIAGLSYREGEGGGYQAVAIAGLAGGEPIYIVLSAACGEWGDRDLFMGYAHRSLGLIPVGSGRLAGVAADHGHLGLQPLRVEGARLLVEGEEAGPISAWGVKGVDFSFSWRGLRPSNLPYSITQTHKTRNSN